MGWTYEQQLRLQREIDILKPYFPDFAYVNVGSNLCLEGWMTTNSKNMYKLRLYIPHDIPNSIPDTVIVYPNPVTDHWGRDLKSYGSSATMHLLAGRDDYPKICTYKGTHWNANITFYKILMKVRLWLEALDGHKATGKVMDHYLTHQL